MSKEERPVLDAFEKKWLKIWIILLLPTTALMLFLLISGENSLNFTLVILLIVLKFLGGLGLAAGISSLIIFVLTKYEAKFQGEENKKKLKQFLIGVLCFFIFLLIYQGPVKIVQSVQAQGDADNFLDKIMFVYGIVSLMVNLYIKPLIKNEFFSVTTVSTGEMIKKGLTDGVRGMKKRVFEWRENYAKSAVQDQLTLKEFISTWQHRTAVIVLPFIGIGCMVFTPLLVIFILLWLRIFYYNQQDPYKFEIYLLIIASIAICVIGILIAFVLTSFPFYQIIKGGYFWVYVFQFAGMLLAALVYLNKLLAPIMQKRRKEQIKDLKDERKSLEDEKKALEKEKQRMKKEMEQLKKQQGQEPSKKDKKNEKETPAPVEEKHSWKDRKKENTAPIIEDKNGKKDKKKDKEVPPPVEDKNTKKDKKKDKEVPSPPVEDKNAKKDKKKDKEVPPPPVEDKNAKKDKKKDKSAPAPVEPVDPKKKKK